MLTTRHQAIECGWLDSAARGFSSRYKSRSFKILVWVIVSLVYFSRIIFLESDLVPWGVLTYQPMDEGIYSALAINLYNLGVLDPGQYYGNDFALVTSQEITNLPLNTLVYLGLITFGDNYYGLRMGSVLVGYLCILLTFFITKCLFNKSESLAPYASLAGLICVALLVFCFPFYNATRVVESSLYRLFFALLVVYLFVTPKLGLRLKSFLIGFFVIGSIFLVYVTNTFLGILVLGYLALLAIKKRYGEAAQYAIFCSLGALLAYFASLLYFKGVWDTTPLANVLALTGSFMASSGSANAHYGDSYSLSSIAGILQNFRYIASSNVVLYDFPLVGLFFLIGPSLRSKKLSNLREDMLCLALAMGGYLLQTLIVSDFVVRKEVIIYPIFIIFLVLAIFSALTDKDRSWRLAGWKRVVVGVVICVWAVYMAVFRLFLAGTSFVTAIDFELGVCVAIMICVAIFVIAVVVFGWIGRTSSQGAFAVGGMILLSVTLSVAMNVGLIVKYNFVDATFADKQAMIEIGEVADGKVVCGDYFYGFTLYNDALPLSNDRNVLLEYLGTHPDAYYLDYVDVHEFTQCPTDTWQTLRPVREFGRCFKDAYAYYPRDIALFETTYEGGQ